VDLPQGAFAIEDRRPEALRFLHIYRVRPPPYITCPLCSRFFTVLCRIESGVIYSVSVLIYLILGAIPSTVIVQDPVIEMLAQMVVCCVP
jgi:hypothetical protein